VALSLTCTNSDCGAVLEAETEDELVELAQAHAQSHGHTRPIPREHVVARIRRHNAGDPSQQVVLPAARVEPLGDSDFRGPTPLSPLMTME
jgi:hypothetical protein